MKKLMILAAIAATAFAAVAAALDPKTCTEAEVRAALGEVLAQPDQHKAWQCGQTSKLWGVLCTRQFSSLRAEADDALAAKGYGMFWVSSEGWPKISKIQRDKNGATAAYSRSIATAERLGANLTAGSIVYHGGGIDDVVVLIEEIFAFPRDCSVSVAFVDDAKKAVQQLVQKHIKKWLRAQGKSFVTKNGVNPCQECMTALADALNAPRFAGLDAWLKGVGMKGVDLSRLPSEAVVAKLREDIMNGDKEMCNRDKAVLYVCLGVDGYNAFVREYNGE